MRTISVLIVLMLGNLALGQQLERSKGWAWSGIAATTLENRNKPEPAPAPKPGDVCPSCKGEGRVGDGRIFTKCLDCNGTGKVPSASLQSFRQQTNQRIEALGTIAGIPATEIVSEYCADGRCDLPPYSWPSAGLPVQSAPMARIESAPVVSQACPGGVCPIPQSAQTYRSYQPQVVRRGWIFRR